MKKGLIALSAVLALTISTNLSAQVDTISNFFTGTLALYGVGPLPDDGYIAGNNTYDDKAKMMLFDDSHGVDAVGTIEGVLLAITNKKDAGGSFQVAIWDDVNGVPSSTPLTTKTVTITSVDMEYIC